MMAPPTVWYSNAQTVVLYNHVCQCEPNLDSKSLCLLVRPGSLIPTPASLDRVYRNDWEE